MDKEEIKKIIQEIIAKVHNDESYTITIEEDNILNTTRFSIESESPQILIGYRGTALQALNHIVKKVVDRRLSKVGDESFHFILDVNKYQKKQIEELKNKAEMLAERARSFKTEVEMDPMSPYERMVIHSVLSKVSDIKTESRGEGRDRRVVIQCTKVVV